MCRPSHEERPGDQTRARDHAAVEPHLRWWTTSPFDGGLGIRSEKEEIKAAGNYNANSDADEDEAGLGEGEVIVLREDDGESFKDFTGVISAV